MPAAVTVVPTDVHTALAAGSTMPFMICLMLATGVIAGASTGATCLVERAATTMNPTPHTKSAMLTRKSQ